jgi:hypothetical protein
MSEKHQFVDNPLLLTDLFSKGVYYFGEATEASPVGAQQVDGESISEVIDSANGAMMPPAESDISTKKGEEILSEINPNEEEMINLTLINMFFDDADQQWDTNVEASYHKLMSALKVNQEPIIPEDIEKMLLLQTDAYEPSLQGDRLSPIIFIWSDREIQNVPNMYKAKPTEKGIMLRFPSFQSMCLDVEKKKMVWQTMKQVLKF